MREIKFRAWDGERMYFWGFLGASGLGTVFAGPPASGRGNPMTMMHMQYTGLKDKNGKEIYEGDIVRGESGFYVETVLGVVGYGGMAFHYKGNGMKSGEEWFMTITNPETKTDKNIEVIGNVYENQELLK